MATTKRRTGMTWQEKFERPAGPKIVKVPPTMVRQAGPGRMLIATPRLIDALVRRIPSRKLATMAQLMDRLARDHDCERTCPMTAGIFMRIVAEKAEEDLATGSRQVAPYWRVIKTDGSLNDRFPGGVKRQAGMLKAEGHEFATRGSRVKVKDFANRLARL
jgi:hypothetical protein